MANTRGGRTGALPTAEQQIIVALFAAHKANKIAREQATLGVDPEYAAAHGMRATNATLYYWIYVAPVAAFAALAIGARNELLNLWGICQVGLAIVLYLRLKRYVSTRGDLTIKYQIPTRLLVVLGALLNVALVIGWLISLAMPISYPPPVQQTPTPTIHTPTVTAPTYQPGQPSAADPMTTTPNTDMYERQTPGPCKSFRPGHNVHWVQALRARNDTDHGHEPAELLRVDAHGWFEVRVAGTTHRLWHHDPSALRRSLPHRPLGTINLHWSIVVLANYMSVATLPTPCVFHDPTGPPEQQLESHGGFSIPGREALKLCGFSNTPLPQWGHLRQTRTPERGVQGGL